MKAYWNSLTKAQQVRLAKNVGSTRDYLRLVFNGHKNAGFNLAIRLEQETAGRSLGRSCGLIFISSP